MLKNCTELIKTHNYFTVIFAAPYSMDDPYVAVLNKLAAKHPKDTLVLYNMDFVTTHYMLQWRNTRILAILSRAEPFGVIPIEARFYNNPSLTLLTSNSGGLPFQIKDGVDGFITNLEDGDIRTALKSIAAMSQDEKTRVAQAGFEKVITEFSQNRVNERLLDEFISRV